MPASVFSLDSLEAERWFALVVDTHPDLAKARARVQETAVNRRFYAQDLIPEGYFEGYALKEGGTGVFNDWPGIEDNYKYGIGVSTPLLLMRGRGRFNAAGARLETATLDSALTRRELQLTVLAATYDLTTVDTILDLQERAITQARVLRTGEIRRFENGESTIFLVNQRDRLLLDQLLKQADFEARFVASRAAVAVALGQQGWLSTSPTPLGAGVPEPER
jgi:outer membrane protein TolC